MIDGVESVCVMPVSVCLTACGDVCGVCVFCIVGDEWLLLVLITIVCKVRKNVSFVPGSKVF